MQQFEYDKTLAKIQGLSVQVGELFAELYQDWYDYSDTTYGPRDVDKKYHALEAYKSLRRLLPRENPTIRNSRHLGASAAHKATQERRTR